MQWLRSANSALSRVSSRGAVSGWLERSRNSGVHPLGAPGHHRFAATALLTWLGADEQPHVGLNGGDQGLEVLAFALQAGLAEVEIPSGEDVEPLLRLPSGSHGGDIWQSGEFKTAAGLLKRSLYWVLLSPAALAREEKFVIGCRPAGSPPTVARHRGQQKARSEELLAQGLAFVGIELPNGPLRPFMRASTRSL